MLSSTFDWVCGDLALPRDDILDDISFDIRQAEIMGCQSTSVKPPALTTSKKNLSTLSSTIDSVCGDLALPRDDILDDIPLDIRQAEIAPGVAIRQAGMIQPKEL